MSRLNRRKFMGSMAAGAGSVAAMSLLGGRAFAQESRIRHYWWGNPSWPAPIRWSGFDVSA